jgi:hypothetical protein
VVRNLSPPGLTGIASFRAISVWPFNVRPFNVPADSWSLVIVGWLFRMIGRLIPESILRVKEIGIRTHIWSF